MFSEYGLTVFPVRRSDRPVFAGICIIEPDIPCNGRALMLPPLILPSFFIVIEDLLSVPAYPGILRRNRKHLIYTPACCRHAVKFRLGGGRVLPVLFRIETHTANEYGGVIGSK